MPTNTVVNNTVDVVELHSNTDLTLESNTQIKFSTSNILINYIPFDEYINKVVFGNDIRTNLNNSSDVHSWSSAVTHPTTVNKIDLANNTSELIVDELHCSGVSATHSHVNSKYHYINLSATNNIYINNNQNSTNVVYNKVGDQLYSLSNYIYKVINTPASHTADALVPESFTIPSPSVRTDISSLGTYIGHRVITSNISTITVTDVLDETDGVGEPVLEFDSQTAVNFVTDVVSTPPGNVNAGSKIFFGSLSLDSLVKSQLDETGLLAITASLTSGQNIGMEITGFTNSGGNRYDSFEYDVTFRVYDHPTGTTLDLSTATPHDFDQTTTLSLPFLSPQTFTLGNSTYPLQAGRFYTVVATFTNLRTNTVVENVILEPRSVATIEFITGLSAQIVDEDTLRVTFNNHATVVSGVTVEFEVIIRWNSTSVSYGSGVSQSLNGSRLITINIPAANIHGYGTNVLDNTAHEFQIQTTGPFTILNDDVSNVSYNFTNPYIPSGLTFNGTNFTWSHEDQPKINNVDYEISNSLTEIGTTTNTKSFAAPSSILSTIDLDSQRNQLKGLIPTTYRVRARHAYGYSGYAELTVNPLRITTPSLSLSHNKKINLSYTVSDSNGGYSISSNKSLDNSNTFFTVSNPSNPLSSSELHSVWVQVTDSFGLRMRSSNASITVYRPTILLGALTYVTGSTREYTSSVSITTGNTTTILSVSYTTLVGMTFVSNTTSEIRFRLDNTDQNSIAVSAIITVKDYYGFQNNITLSETELITFDNTNNTIAYIPFTTGGFRNNSVSTVNTLSYLWSGFSSIDGATSDSVTLLNTDVGTLGCVVTEITGKAFTNTYTAVSMSISYPNLVGVSFAISSPTTFDFSITVDGVTKTSDEPNLFEVYVSNSSSSLNIISSFYTGNTYYLWGATKNFGLITPTQYLSKYHTLTITNPTGYPNKHVTSNTSLYYNIQSYGSEGDAFAESGTVVLYYMMTTYNDTSDFDISHPSVYSMSLNGYSSGTRISIPNLQYVKWYKFKMVKTYPGSSTQYQSFVEISQVVADSMRSPQTVSLTQDLYTNHNLRLTFTTLYHASLYYKIDLYNTYYRGYPTTPVYTTVVQLGNNVTYDEYITENDIGSLFNNIPYFCVVYPSINSSDFDIYTRNFYQSTYIFGTITNLDNTWVISSTYNYVVFGPVNITVTSAFNVLGLNHRQITLTLSASPNALTYTISKFVLYKRESDTSYNDASTLSYTLIREIPFSGDTLNNFNMSTVMTPNTFYQFKIEAHTNLGVHDINKEVVSYAAIMKYDIHYHIFIRDANGNKLYLKKLASADWTVLTTTTNKAEATNLVFRNDRSIIRPYYASYGSTAYTSLELETPHNNGDYDETYLVHHIMDEDAQHTFVDYDAYFEGETIKHFNHPNLIGGVTRERQWMLGDLQRLIYGSDDIIGIFEIGAVIMIYPYVDTQTSRTTPNFRLTYVDNAFKLVYFKNYRSGYIFDKNAQFYLEHPTDTTKFDHV